MMDMKEEIKELIEYANNPRYSAEDENYISDGEMLDIILDRLKKLV